MTDNDPQIPQSWIDQVLERFPRPLKRVKRYFRRLKRRYRRKGKK